MALGSVGGFELPYFTKKKALRKVDILDKFRNDSELMSYIPDGININSLTRDFLLSILMQEAKTNISVYTSNTKKLWQKKRIKG